LSLQSGPDSWTTPREHPRLTVDGTLLYSEGQAQVVDMSLGGLGLVSQNERPLSIGDQLDFLISSERAEWFGPFSAHVVWAQPRRAGLKFSPRCDRAAIEAALHSLQQNSKPRPEA
jgi:hypothetical protein